MPKVRPLVVTLVALSFISIVHAQRRSGAVVVRDGLIDAVGANVNAPPDARVIDGTGLTIYPGLIDSYTNLALPEPAPGPSPGGGGGGGGFFLLQQLQQQQRAPSGPNSTQPAGL